MTDSTIRLWDHDFAFIAVEDVPDTAIDDNGDQIEITLDSEASPIREAIVNQARPLLTNLHITIDAKPGHRRGGIIREISFHAGTFVLLIHVHSRTPQQPETIYPPRGYGIGLPGGGNDRDIIFGNWATEAEARQALADLRIVALGGAQPSWDTGR